MEDSGRDPLQATDSETPSVLPSVHSTNEPIHVERVTFEAQGNAAKPLYVRAGTRLAFQPRPNDNTNAKTSKVSSMDEVTGNMQVKSLSKSLKNSKQILDGDPKDQQRHPTDQQLESSDAAAAIEIRLVTIRYGITNPSTMSYRASSLSSRPQPRRRIVYP